MRADCRQSGICSPSRADSWIQWPTSKRSPQPWNETTKDVESAVRGRVTIEMTLLIVDLVPDTLQKSFHNVLSSTQTGMYSFLNSLLLDILRKHVIGKQLHTHVAEFIQHVYHCGSIWYTLLIFLSTFVLPFAILVKCKTNTTVHKRNVEVAKTWENKPLNTM